MSVGSPQRYIGAISGTSLDGIDLALVEISADGVITVAAGRTVTFDGTLRAELRALALAETDDIDAMGHADVATGEAIAGAVITFRDGLGLQAAEIRAVGSHGQTIRHRPGGTHPFTLQIGDPNVIAERTGITTVADFRRRDMAAGGEGAPLVPLFHRALFHSDVEDRIVLNIGGIANITTLQPGSPTTGFDTGPGNALMDAWIQHHQGQDFDNDGAWQASGTLEPALLARFLEDPYFSMPPPKSTGKELFNQAWLEEILATQSALPANDVQATLAELTAVSIAAAIDRWGTKTGPVIACGGGRLNGPLMARLAGHLPAHDVSASEAFGVNGDWLEAAAFAYFAHRRLGGLPGNVATVTGATGDRVLGGVYSA